jgi:hypothetical protein
MGLPGKYIKSKAGLKGNPHEGWEHVPNQLTGDLLLHRVRYSGYIIYPSMYEDTFIPSQAAAVGKCSKN